jgi:hypothetical protein
LALNRFPKFDIIKPTFIPDAALLDTGSLPTFAAGTCP